MLGLSNSPVLGSFLTPILGIVVAGLAALAALQSEEKWLPVIGDLAPVGLFLLMCSVFSTLGVWIRSNQFLVTAELRIEEPTGAGGLFNSFSVGQCSELLATEVVSAPVVLDTLGITDTGIGRALLAAAEIDQATFDTVVNALCAS